MNSKDTSPLFAVHEADLKELVGNLCKGFENAGGDTSISYGTSASVTFYNNATNDIKGAIAEVNIDEDDDSIIDLINGVLADVEPCIDDFLVVVTLTDQNNGDVTVSEGYRFRPEDDDAGEGAVI